MRLQNLSAGSQEGPGEGRPAPQDVAEVGKSQTESTFGVCRVSAGSLLSARQASGGSARASADDAKLTECGCAPIKRLTESRGLWIWPVLIEFRAEAGGLGWPDGLGWPCTSEQPAPESTVPGWGWCIQPGPALQTDGGDVLNVVAAHPEQLTHCKTNSDACWASEGRWERGVCAHLCLPQ